MLHTRCVEPCWDFVSVIRQAQMTAVHTDTHRDTDTYILLTENHEDISSGHQGACTWVGQGDKEIIVVGRT